MFRIIFLFRVKFIILQVCNFVLIYERVQSKVKSVEGRERIQALSIFAVLAESAGEQLKVCSVQSHN